LIQFHKESDSLSLSYDTIFLFSEEVIAHILKHVNDQIRDDDPVVLLVVDDGVFLEDFFSRQQENF